MAGAGTMNTARDGRIVAVNRLFSELLAHGIADLRDRRDWSGDEAGRCCRIKKNATLLVALFLNRCRLRSVEEQINQNQYDRRHTENPRQEIFTHEMLHSEVK